MSTPADLLTSKIPPHDLGAERALIGAVLCAAGQVPTPPLRPEEFYKEAHRKIWAACLAVEALDGAAHLVTVAAYLEGRKELDEVGGPSHLALCIEDGCCLYPLTGAARVVRELATQRQKIQLGADLVQDSTLTPAEIDGRLAAMPGPLAQALWDPAHTWETITSRWGEAGLRTGWSTLDRLTGELWPGELIVVGGRTSHGKSAFMCATALRMAAEGMTVDIVTLEDPIEAITRRLVAVLTGIAYRRLRIGDISDIERATAARAVGVLSHLPLHVTGIDRHGQATEDGVLGLLSQATGRVVILDHLQRVVTKDQSRAYALERVLGRIHSLAQRTGQVAWVNCQLNREVEARKDGKPTLADLRDSGAIEILARQVWLLSWPRKWDPKRDYRDYLVDVAKASESGTGPVDFRWDPATGRFWTPDEGPPWDLEQTPAWVTDKD